MIRSETLWKSEAEWLFDEDTQRFLVYGEGGIKAYVRCHKNLPYIMEYGYENGFEKEFQELLTFCSFELKLKFGTRKLYMPLVNKPEIDDFLCSQLKDPQEIFNF